MGLPLAYNREYALNAICPYFTMFPLEYPLRILRRHRRSDLLVLDPFCGRGTTIYAARKLNLRSYGFDVSPIAVAIAQAKLCRADSDDILALAKTLIALEPSNVPDTPFFRMAYSPATLKQICSLREGLLRVREETNETVLLRAASLGCLHGPRAKDLSRSGYFSNQMPRTFSSKPDYSVKYWKSNGLTAPRVSVLDVLKRKLDRVRDLNSPTIGSFDRIECTDAREAASYRNMKGPLVVITSPPYYGMRTYVQDQWLRSWFLGGPAKVDYRGVEQLSHSSHEHFVHDLARVWDHLKNKSGDVNLYVRLGTIPSVKSNPRKLLQSSLEESGGWKLLHTRRAKTASAGKRQADQMRGESSAQDEFDFHAVAT